MLTNFKFETKLKEKIWMPNVKRKWKRMHLKRKQTHKKREANLPEMEADR